MSKERRNRKTNGSTRLAVTTAGKKDIVCFRLPPEIVNTLTKQLEDHPVVGVRSPHQLSRKIIIDYCLGNLVYPAAGLKSLNPQMVPTEG